MGRRTALNLANCTVINIGENAMKRFCKSDSHAQVTRHVHFASIFGATLLLGILLLLPLAAGVARAAKPGPPPPPPPPPVQYVLKWLGPGLTWAMNDAGTIVGEAGGHATLYTA